MNFDDELRAALRPSPPPRDLLPGVRARLASPPRRPTPRWRWAPALIAVIVLIAALGVVRWRGQVRQRQARADARQITNALQLASNKLAHVRASVAGAAY